MQAVSPSLWGHLFFTSYVCLSTHSRFTAASSTRGGFTYVQVKRRFAQLKAIRCAPARPSQHQKRAWLRTCMFACGDAAALLACSDSTVDYLHRWHRREARQLQLVHASVITPACVVCALQEPFADHVERELPVRKMPLISNLQPTMLSQIIADFCLNNHLAALCKLHAGMQNSRRGQQQSLTLSPECFAGNPSCGWAARPWRRSQWSHKADRGT